jgi:putative hemolysin
MGKMWGTIILACLILIGAVFAMKSRFHGNKIQQNTSNAQVANPASVHCVNHGGKVEIKIDANGGQFGNCVFANGKVCEEWAYFRRECGAE